MTCKLHFKKILFAMIASIAFVSSIYAEESLGNESEIQSQKIKNHFLDLGVGLGLDYGGLIGAKLSYILPFPHISVFGAVGAQPLGLGWSVGTTFHILPQNSKYVFRPNLKIMYGINRTTIVVGASKYDEMFAGWTPGIGLEFMFGKRKANGFDIDLNFPIGSSEFNDQLKKIEDDPRVGAITILPVAFSIGYHHEF
jgi:hypothetical protein